MNKGMYLTNGDNSTEKLGLEFQCFSEKKN